MKNTVRALHVACSEQLYRYTGFAAAVAVYDTVGKLHKYAARFVASELAAMQQAAETPELVEYYIDNAISLLWDTVEWIIDADEPEALSALRAELTALFELISA